MNQDKNLTKTSSIKAYFFYNMNIFLFVRQSIAYVGTHYSQFGFMSVGKSMKHVLKSDNDKNRCDTLSVCESHKKVLFTFHAFHQ